MSFDSLLGNEQLKTNLARSLGKGHVSHFYLVSGPRGSGKHTLARLLSAAIVCRESSRPCLRCPACRKVMENTHPDLITVDDPEKATVSVKLVREARADIYVRPNEADYKIYLFPRAQDMRLEGQNALLKVLEEPPQYGVFLLLTDNPNKLLPTVRSRCTELKLQSLPEGLLRQELTRQFPKALPDDIDAAIARSGGFLGQAQELIRSGGAVPEETRNFVNALSAKDNLLLLQTLVPMEKWKRDVLQETLQSWLEITAEALACRCGIRAISPLARQLAAARSKPELYQYVEHLRKCVEYVAGNVSPAAVCGWLEWALR